MYRVEGKTGKWELVIGLEVHAQIISKSKLFSGASTKFGAEPNEQVSIVDAAMPGMLPVLNGYCVKQAVKTGCGLNAKINLFSQFDRKNYFYADLPQGYQISQFYHPIVGKGWLKISGEEGTEKIIGITRLHLEQDAGKSIHDQSPTSTFIDLNRAGVALMEIVSEPDISSPKEAGEYIKKLRSILKYLDTCDADMEKGNLRCDANVSVRRPGENLGTRCEIKNLNSIKNMMQAIEYEAQRQISIIEDGGIITQQTRLFDVNIGETRTMRSKENAHDYRYFPDPDLLPIRLEQKFIDEIAQSLPELPDVKQERYIKDYKLSAYDAEVLCVEKEIALFFEEVVAHCSNAKMAANWITAEFFGRLNKTGTKLNDAKVSALDLADLLIMINNDVISGKIAKQVLDIMFETGKNPKIIVEQQGLKQLSNEDDIMLVINEILINHQDKVVQYKSGKDKLFGFFVGQVMKVTKGMANPQLVNKLLKNKLNKQ